jgi:hypothetical protein
MLNAAYLSVMRDRKRMASRNETVLNHYQSFFRGHNHDLCTWESGPIKELVPSFQVFRAAPGPQINLWTYASIGASSLWQEDSGLLEFIVHSPVESPRLVETLAMIAHYHVNHNLGNGHTLPIGEPWLENSECDHWLISKPYPLGPELEICNLEDTHIHVLWLLPITESEKNYKMEHGLEALEQVFEEKGLEFWDIQRSSITKSA